LLVNAIPIYKRLKLVEDSLIMARMTRGILWYLYKIKVAGGNMDTAAEIVQNYSEYLKRNTSMGLDIEAGTWRDKWAPIFAQIEDLFVPESDDVSISVEKLGGEPNIKAIVDVEMLTNQLLGALRVSRFMLGITDEMPGALGEGAAVRISINFAKNAQRLQSALRNGVKRLCQIHLAYRNLNPDPTRYEVNFAEISSAEEEEIKNALDKGVDIVDKILDTFEKAGVKTEEQKLEMLDYLNQKILKLNDLDLKEMAKKVMAATATEKKQKPKKIMPVYSDLYSHVPHVNGKKLDEATKRMVQTNDSMLNESQRALKKKILSTEATKVFRVDESHTSLIAESTSWAPINVKVEVKQDATGGNK